MTIQTLEEIYSYAVSIRRQLHEYPEIGFDLEKTVGLVSNELDSLGIGYTYCYGKGSVVAEIGQGNRIIALRADMDALPVEEKTNLSYKSKIQGAMHACGHDAHTAILLAVAKSLKKNEEKLKCRVRMIFQPSEEGQVSGAKMLVDNGVMDDVNRIICTHCENSLEVGKIGLCSGDYMAACIPATISFLGRTSHATIPEQGVDAIAMATEAYIELKKMLAYEANGQRYIWSVGRFSGGYAHNVIADRCDMDISFRFYDMEFAERVGEKVREICGAIAQKCGGSVEYNWNMSTGPVYNSPQIVEEFRKSTQSAGVTVVDLPSRLSSEDFGWYLTKVPGILFRFGTRNEKLSCMTAAHCGDFKIDENGMKSAIAAFLEYVLKCGCETYK